MGIMQMSNSAPLAPQRGALTAPQSLAGGTPVPMGSQSVPAYDPVSNPTPGLTSFTGGYIPPAGSPGSVNSAFFATPQMSGITGTPGSSFNQSAAFATSPSFAVGSNIVGNQAQAMQQQLGAQMAQYTAPPRTGTFGTLSASAPPPTSGGGFSNSPIMGTLPGQSTATTPAASSALAGTPSASWAPNAYPGDRGSMRIITLPDGTKSTYYGFTGDPNDPYGYGFNGSTGGQNLTNPATWGGGPASYDMTKNGLSGEFPVQSLSGQIAQQYAQMQSMSPAALRGDAQAGANVWAANGGANLIGLPPAAMVAANYASANPGAPEVLKAGGFNNLVNQYANAPNAWVLGGGAPMPQSQVPSPDAGAYRPLYSGATPWQPSGWNPIAPSAAANAIPSSGPIPASGLAGNNTAASSAAALDEKHRMGGLWNDYLPGNYVGGTITPTLPASSGASQALAGKTPIVRTPLGYTQYAGQSAGQQNQLDPLTMYLIQYLMSQGSNPNRAVSLAGLTGG